MYIYIYIYMCIYIYIYICIWLLGEPLDPVVVHDVVHPADVGRLTRWLSADC